MQPILSFADGGCCADHVSHKVAKNGPGEAFVGASGFLKWRGRPRKIKIGLNVCDVLVEPA